MFFWFWLSVLKKYLVPCEVCISGMCLDDAGLWDIGDSDFFLVKALAGHVFQSVCCAWPSLRGYVSLM